MKEDTFDGRPIERIIWQATGAMRALLQAATAPPGEIVVVGCSTSAVLGARIGSAGSRACGEAIVAAILPLLQERGVVLAAQCCEHLNRALIVEKEVALAHRLSVVQAVPVKTAGGSFAAAAYQAMESPVAVAEIQAVCGMDIGHTMIGMHLARVAVPLTLPPQKIGEAHLTFATTRPPYIGGPRTQYLD